MNEEKILQKIEKLEQKIADLRKTKLKNRFLNFFKRSFTKVHLVIGIVITVVASSLIVYATQITKPHTFTDGEVISASQVNDNFDTLYETAWSVGDSGGIYYNSGNVGIGTTSPQTALDVSGDISTNYVATDANEPLAHDIIRHTVTLADDDADEFTESWSKAPVTKIVSMNSVVLSVGIVYSAYDDVTLYEYDNELWYDGTTITVSDYANWSWSVDDVVTIHIVYEK